jgi:hypothetical protein
MSNRQKQKPEQQASGNPVTQQEKEKQPGSAIANCQLFIAYCFFSLSLPSLKIKGL